MYDRSFGVEIECGTPETGRDSYGYATTAGVAGAQKLLGDIGLPHWANRIGWDGTEIEIRSPILHGTQGMSELKRVMNALDSNGYYTTDSDGMHCHFDAQDLNESDIIRLIRSWDNNQEIIHKFLGERFYNGHCTYDYNFEALERKEDEYGYRHSVWEYDGEKCFAIEPRSRLKTVEFRQHYGTLDFEEARAWILLVQAFIKHVKMRKTPVKTVSMDELFRLTRVYKVAQRNLKSRKFSMREPRW